MSTKELSFVIQGQPYSKANSRRFVKVKGIPMFIKSKEAIQYLSAFKMQCPKCDPLIDKSQDVAVDIKIYYQSRRPDLDESLILDAMQGLIYENDRSVKEKHIYWGLDKENPRAEITVKKIPQQ